MISNFAGIETKQWVIAEQSEGQHRCETKLCGWKFCHICGIKSGARCWHVLCSQYTHTETSRILSLSYSYLSASCRKTFRHQVCSDINYDPRITKLLNSCFSDSKLIPSKGDILNLKKNKQVQPYDKVFVKFSHGFAFGSLIWYKQLLLFSWTGSK